MKDKKLPFSATTLFLVLGIIINGLLFYMGGNAGYVLIITLPGMFILVLLGWFIDFFGSKENKKIATNNLGEIHAKYKEVSDNNKNFEIITKAIGSIVVILMLIFVLDIIL